MPLARNNVDLLDEGSFNYGIDQAVVREWIAIAKATQNYCLRHGNNEQRKLRSRFVSSALMLGYSEANGERLLKTTALGLARQLEADFIEVDCEILSSIAAFIKAEYAEILEQNRRLISSGTSSDQSFAASTAKDSTAKNDYLAEFIKRKLEARETKFGRPGGGGLNFQKPYTRCLEYLEHCMRVIDTAAGRRVIFIHYDRLPVNAFLFRVNIAEFILNLAAQGTFVILCEGSNFDPMSHKSPLSLLSVQGDLIDRDLGNARISSIAIKTTTETEEKRETTIKNQHRSLEFLMENDFKAPRLLITPPPTGGDPRAIARHKDQIEKDLIKFNLVENYQIIRDNLEQLAAVDEWYEGLIQALPDAEDEAAMEDLLKDSLYLHKPVSREELLSFCLSISLERIKTTPDLFHLFISSLQEHSRLRSMQVAAIPSLLGVSLNGPKKGSLDLNDLNKYEKRLVPCIVSPGMVTTRYKDIGALDQVKALLYELISLRLERPDFFAKGVLKDSVSGILLFGPPGTGKTMLARAVAAQSGVNFLSVNSSSIYDMYVGEGEKNVKALFTLARKISPCVIFIDEVDALLDARSHSVAKASRVEIINEFMAEWDGLLSQNHGLTIMAATNRPFALDDAVLRRLPRRILIDLPNAAAREQILKLLLKDDNVCTQIDLGRIAEQCTFYSGSDLRNMVMAAAMRALRRFRLSKSDLGIEIKQEDFEGAMEDVPASISEQMLLLTELRQWNRQFGEGNGRPCIKSDFGFN